jgi:hypothetical protein
LKTLRQHFWEKSSQRFYPVYEGYILVHEGYIPVHEGYIQAPLYVLDCITTRRQPGLSRGSADFSLLNFWVEDIDRQTKRPRYRSS